MFSKIENYMRNVEYLQFVDMKMLQQCATMDYIVYDTGARPAGIVVKNKKLCQFKRVKG